MNIRDIHFHYNETAKRAHIGTLSDEDMESHSRYTSAEEPQHY